MTEDADCASLTQTFSKFLKKSTFCSNKRTLVVPQKMVSESSQCIYCFIRYDDEIESSAIPMTSVNEDFSTRYTFPEHQSIF